MAAIEMAPEIRELGVETLHHMGIEILEFTPNRLRARMPLEGNRNHLGIMYAGAIFTFGEFAFGMLFDKRLGFEEMAPVVGEMSVRYYAPAQGSLFVDVTVSEEEWAHIQQETRDKGKLKIEREIEITDEQGKLNSVVKGTYFSLLQAKS